jgi:ATP synthase F1 complex assembly factor 2
LRACSFQFEKALSFDLTLYRNPQLTLEHTPHHTTPHTTTTDERIENLLPYLITDTICYRDPEDLALGQVEKKTWDPIISWFENKYKSPLCVTTLLSGPEHPPQTIDVVKKHLSSMNHWPLTGLELAIDTAKSVVIALSLLDRQLSAAQAVDASRVEVDFQVQRFGYVEWSHGMDKYETTCRLAAAALFVRLTKSFTAGPVGKPNSEDAERLRTSA